MKESKSFYARHGLTLLAAAMFLLPLVVLGALKATSKNNNDVRKWLPIDNVETTQYEWFREHFGLEEFILISWDGCTLDAPARKWDDRGPEMTQLDRLAARLVPHPADAAAPQRRELFERVVTGPELLGELTQAPARLSQREAIARLTGKLIGPDGRQTGAVVTPAAGGKARLHEMLDEVYRIAQTECDIPRESIRMGGPPVINVAVDVEGFDSLRRLAALSAVLGLAIAWWCFRSVKLTLLVFAAGLYSAGCALSIVWYAGTEMNAILLMMPPLVYVAGVSGAIHLVNYYREALSEAGPENAPGHAVAHARVPLSLATTTTAVGLLSLCYSDLLPIQQFGVYSALGVAAGAVVLFFFVPSALSLLPVSAADRPRDEEQHHDDGLLTLSRRWRRFGQGVVRYHGWVALAGLSVLACGAYGVQWMKTSIKVEKFFATEAPILQDYAWLENNLGALVPMELVVRVDDQKCDLNMLERIELVERVQASIESLPDVGSTMSAVTFAPKLPGGSGWSTRRGTFNRRLLKSQDALEKARFLSRDGGDELWRISLRVVAMNDVDYGIFVDDIKSKVEPVLAEARQDGADGLAAVYTGMVPVFNKAQRSLLDGLLFGFGTDLALIIVAVILLLRHWSVGLLIALTSLFPAAVVFGFMSWQGIVVDIGTVMTPSVALGVTVDDVVHFLLWFRRGIARGLDRRQAVMLAYEGCAKPMYQSWGVLGLGLSVFALSGFTPTMRFGALMVSLLTVGLVGNLLLLPALLAGPLGGIFARKIQKREERQERRRRGDRVLRPEPAEEPAEALHKPAGRSVRT